MKDKLEIDLTKHYVRLEFDREKNQLLIEIAESGVAGPPGLFWSMSNQPACDDGLCMLKACPRCGPHLEADGVSKMLRFDQSGPLRYDPRKGLLNSLSSINQEYGGNPLFVFDESAVLPEDWLKKAKERWGLDNPYLDSDYAGRLRRHEQPRFSLLREPEVDYSQPYTCHANDFLWPGLTVPTKLEISQTDAEPLTMPDRPVTFPHWKCTGCGLLNPSNSRICNRCGEAREEYDAGN